MLHRCFILACATRDWLDEGYNIPIIDPSAGTGTPLHRYYARIPSFDSLSPLHFDFFSICEQGRKVVMSESC